MQSNLNHTFFILSTFAVAIKLQRRVKASAQHSKTSLTLRSPCTSLALANPGTLGSVLQSFFELLIQEDSFAIFIFLLFVFHFKLRFREM